MAEHLMLSEIDPGQDPNLFDQARKWGGRIVLGAIMTHYAGSWFRHAKNNPLVRHVEEVIHHEHQENPEDQQ